MYLEIEKYKPTEPFLKYSILGNRPLPYQAKVREAYCNPIVVWTVAAVIIGNFIVNILEKEYDPDPKELKYAELWISFDTAFNAIFLVELLWNMYGFGFGKRFWYSGWNVFDFIITGVGVVLLAGVTGPISQLKLLRAFRVFRLFKRVKSLNKIVVALIAAVPGVSNAFAILFIFYCIYAILAVELFRDFGINGTYMTDDLGSIRHVVDSTTPRGYTHGIEYYGTYSRAMYTLFEIMTGDSNFEALARPLTFGLYQRSAFTVSFFFVSFIILTSMVMSNVVVAVLLDQFVAPPPAGLTDNEVTLFIDYLKEELSTKKSLEGIDANPIEGLGDDALSKLIERMEQRTERTEQYILRLEEGVACMELPGLAAAISAVHAIIAQAEAMGVRSERIVLGGFGIASFSGWTAGPCIANEANVETPILLCHGTADHEVAYALMSESVQMLRKQHAATRIVEHTLDGLGHATNAAESALLRTFFDQVLPCLEPTDTDAVPAALPATPALTKSVIKHPDVEISEIQSEIAGAWKIVVRNLDDAEKGMADLDLSLSAQKLSLEVRGRPAPIVVLLPSAVDEDSAMAKFSTKRRELVVTLRPLLLPELD
ncbi:hypothetical protein Ctob_014654 [Chrysochromulina tobinii]|uniref:Ion transport domain-containing protein n=1 Tax=Chrysochromulina tobinii TaxID=1460289 RepID=A0A0M0JU78_9EUKA|nr:hypothetical protein Ctob_014654 [Chrysochromulina tobinii]|eukprot:KOO30060.1 hypothetical protein Ctob_014654 [Chrysochromulina sp. CCMP291]